MWLFATHRMIRLEFQANGHLGLMLRKGRGGISASMRAGTTRPHTQPIRIPSRLDVAKRDTDLFSRKEFLDRYKSESGLSYPFDYLRQRVHGVDLVDFIGRVTLKAVMQQDDRTGS
jgi:hypothetical protein